MDPGRIKSLRKRHLETQYIGFRSVVWAKALGRGVRCEISLTAYVEFY